MDETPMEDHSRDMEVAPALIAVHPSQESVAVAVGSDLRVFDLRNGCPVALVDDSTESLHKDSIRAICYGANGKLFISAGDDKLVKLLLEGSKNFTGLKNLRCSRFDVFLPPSSEKKVSAVALSNDGLFVCFADKFGVVWVVDLYGLDENQALASKKAVPILAHYCSIITSLEFSPDGRFIVSGDRDFKIRVTVFPKKPLDGAHEIQSFCLGHTEFVSCLTLIRTSDYHEGFLLSGSGDSTVRLWDVTSGSLLDTCEVGAEAGFLPANGKEEESSPAITNLCAIPSNSLVAVAIQSLSGIVLLSYNLSDKSLSVAKVISIMGEAFIPTSLATSSTANLLWMVTGVSNLQGFDTASLARVRVVSGFSETKSDFGELEPIVLEDDDIPWGMQLLERLQGSTSFEKEVFLAAAKTLKTAMHNLFIKKQYMAEKREFRKRGRNDRKIKQ